jgi:hypothetical protein
MSPDSAFTSRTRDAASPTDPGDGHGANPMWQWQGGSGSCPHRWYFYKFSEDGTIHVHDTMPWPTSVTYGLWVTAPMDEVGMRFPYLPERDEPYRYNPYVALPPDYNTPPPTLAASISGPTEVQSGASSTWRVSISAGTAPYTVRWSGVGSGTSTTLTTRLYSSGYLSLNVTDASGVQLATSTYITVSCVSGTTQCTQ